MIPAKAGTTNGSSCNFLSRVASNTSAPLSVALTGTRNCCVIDYQRSNSVGSWLSQFFKMVVDCVVAISVLGLCRFTAESLP